MKTKKTYWIDNPAQISLLTSGMRQEIIDSISALGSCSIADLALELGVPADSLYYHVRKLVKAGLLVKQGIRNTARRDEVVYTVPDHNMHLKYEPNDPVNVESINKIISAMMRMAERDFHSGFTPDLATVEGEARNLWASRYKAWLTEEELGEINEILAKLVTILRRPKLPGDRKLYTITWVISPKKARAKRRDSSKSGNE